jgi:hypothetical protein
MSIPPTYPPTFFQSLLETTAYLRSAKGDDSIDKLKLCESMENRLSVLIGKVVTASTGESFRVFQAAAEPPPPSPE